jgi:hypothetical protein
MSTTKVKQGKRHNVQEDIMKSKEVSDTTYINSSNIEMILTIILTFASWSKAHCLLEASWCGGCHLKIYNFSGGEKGLHL